MVSAGLLLPLLMSCYFLVSTTVSGATPQPGEKTPEDFNKVKAGFFLSANYALRVLEKVTGGAVSVAALIPAGPYGVGAGMAAAGALSLANVGLSLLNEDSDSESDKENLFLSALGAKFDELQSTLDNYHTEERFDRWLFHDTNKDISVAWEMFVTMGQNAVATDDAVQCLKHMKEFVDKHKPKYIYDLHVLLKESGNKFAFNVGDLLGEYAHCHENDIKSYTGLFYSLSQKGNMMNLFYYMSRGLISSTILEKQFRMTHDALFVMSIVWQQCIVSSMEYALKDVAEIMDKHTADDRQVLANEVNSFLDKMFDKYDWFVVAFKTKKSSHYIIETRNSHILTNFRHVQRGDVTVSVARQVKGKQPSEKNKGKIDQAIGNCIKAAKVCYKMGEELKKCEDIVILDDWNKMKVKIKINNLFTSAHAYMWESKPHQAISGKETETEDCGIVDDVAYSDSKTPYTVSKECDTAKPLGKKGKFVVLIKSEEEILDTDPCVKLNNCGGNDKGSCNRLDDVFLATCMCKYPYYGETCEKNIMEYLKEFQGSLKKLPAIPKSEETLSVHVST